MKRIIELSENDYKALKEDGVQNHIALADKVIANCEPYGETPQGKWIKIFENPFTNGYICPFCGHKIQVTEQFLPKVTECESCGADMKGGAE